MFGMYRHRVFLLSILIAFDFLSHQGLRYERKFAFVGLFAGSILGIAHK